MENTVLQILIQGGLTSVALVSLYINYKIVTNHISHQTEVSQKLSDAIQGLIDFLRKKR